MLPRRSRDQSGERVVCWTPLKKLHKFDVGLVWFGFFRWFGLILLALVWFGSAWFDSTILRFLRYRGPRPGLLKGKSWKRFVSEAVQLEVSRLEIDCGRLTRWRRRWSKWGDLSNFVYVFVLRYRRVMSLSH